MEAREKKNISVTVLFVYLWLCIFVPRDGVSYFTEVKRVCHVSGASARL